MSSPASKLLSKNQLIALEKIKIAREHQFTFLDLRGLFLDSLPDDISDMIYLLDIDLSFNQFVNLPSSLKKLENLLYLDISNNFLTELDFEYGKYYSLKELNISNNYLNHIPKSLDFFEHTSITFHSNPFLRGIPIEFENHEFSKVRHYLNLLSDNREVHRFYETKLIFVGRGEVGKTTLMKVLKDQNTKVELGTEHATHGINIDSLNYNIHFPAKPPHYNSYSDIENVFRVNDYEAWKDWQSDTEDEDDEEPNDHDFYPTTHISEILPQLEDEAIEELMFTNDLTQFDDFIIKKPVRINLWDFGGQEIYYSTHQFFLTKRSIYLFVWEPRKDHHEEEFDYWLNTINLLGSNSPIIVVMNKSDIRQINIDENGYFKKFPSIKKFLRVSCLEKYGLAELKQSITRCVKEFSHIGERIPSAWINIREKIRLIKSDYISYTDFATICIQDSIVITRDEITLFSEYLHDIGEIIHFKDDSILKNIVIINPQWATKAVYALIDNLNIQRLNGIFNIVDLESYWDVNIYPVEKHIELLQLMEKFKICFKLIGAKDVYIIPELLTTEVPNREILDEFLEDAPLRFQITYNFMPVGLMTRLICKLYYLIDKKYYWKNGAIFADELSKAYVKESRAERKIEINIGGQQNYNLLALIRNELRHIHQELNLVENESYFEKIPCNCKICADSDFPHFFDFLVLKRFLEKGETSITCYNSVNAVNIYELIAGYSLIKPRKPIIYSILQAVSQLQGQHKIILPSEDARNSFVSGRLSSNNIIAKDQSKWGASSQGLNQGELDIKIEDSEGNIQTIFEGINLKSLVRSKLDSHLQKILEKYDPNGLLEKFFVVYFDGNDFNRFTNNYFTFISEYQYKNFKFFEIIDRSGDGIQHTEIKVYKSVYERSNRKVILYHILVNLE